MDNKQIIIIGVIIIIAVAIVCATVVFLNVNDNKEPVKNETNNVSKNITADKVNTESVK